MRASALGQCRRALWYAATGQDVTNPMTDETRVVLEAGRALEAVVVRAMQRRFWSVTPADPEAPQRVQVEARPGLTVSGHPDATGAVELFGDETVIEVKTRGPEAFKRWRTLGAERSHPESVAQAACYSVGLFDECRDVVIATLDTGARQWDYEVIPAVRVERAWDNACRRLAALAEHHDACGPDPEALPDRDFSASDWQCQRCPYLNRCQPGEAESAEIDAEAERSNRSRTRRRNRRCATTSRSSNGSSRSTPTSAARSRPSSTGYKRKEKPRPVWRGRPSSARSGWSRAVATRSITSGSTRCSNRNSAPRS